MSAGANPLDRPVTFGAHLPEGYIPLSYVAVIKCLDPDGHPVLIHAESDDLSIWEAVGMVRAATVQTEELLHAAACYVEDDEDGEGGDISAV